MGLVFWFESSIIFLSALLWFLNRNMYYGNDAIKRLGFLFPAVTSLQAEWTANQYCILICAFSYGPSRTPVKLRHVKECFDFYNIWEHAEPSSPPAVRLANQTTLFNYSELLIQRPILFSNWDEIKIVLADVKLRVHHCWRNLSAGSSSLHQWNTQQYFEFTATVDARSVRTCDTMRSFLFDVSVWDALKKEQHEKRQHKRQRL